MEKNESFQELCSRIERLKNKTNQLQDNVFFLEAEVIALGNILLKHGILNLKELEEFTSAAVKQKYSEDQIKRKNSYIPALQEEFVDALQKKIVQ